MTDLLHVPRNRLVTLVRTAAMLLVLASVFATSAVAAGSPPQTSSPPTIEGQPVVGKTLSAGNGIWANNPTSFSYQWVRCDAQGNNCAAISGATSRTYTVGNGDLNHTLVVLVAAKNASGSSTANSHPSAVVSAPTAPRNTQSPRIAGNPQVGEALVADPGKFSGAGTTTYAFQWQRCDSTGTKCADISGATGQTYGVLKADLGHTLRVRVKATNQYGSTNTVSKPTAAVTEPATPPVPVTTSLTASSPTTICCQTVRLSGSASSGQAGEPITILAREFGYGVSYLVATTTTDASGGWSVRVTPTIATTYLAQTSSSKSAPLTIVVHPRVGFGVSGNTFSAKVTARGSLGGRLAYFQSRTSRGWHTLKLVVVNLQSIAKFQVKLKRGHTYYVRIYLPQIQAGPGYLDGSSAIRQVGGTS